MGPGALECWTKWAPGPVEESPGPSPSRITGGQRQFPWRRLKPLLPVTLQGKPSPKRALESRTSQLWLYRTIFKLPTWAEPQASEVTASGDVQKSLLGSC